MKVARRAFGPALVTGMGAYALLLQRRLAGVPVLEPTDEPAAADHRIVAARDVVVDDATRREASRHARVHGLDVVDLVPADLPVEPLLTLAAQVTPASFRDDPVADGVGADHALLVSLDVLDRSGTTTTDGLTPLEMHRLTRTLKRYAPRTTSHAVAPRLRARTIPDPAHRRAAVASAWAMGAPLALGTRVATTAWLAARAVRGRPWGRLGALAFSLQPAVAVAGTPFRPSDLRRTPALRLVTALHDRWTAFRSADPPMPPAGGGDVDVDDRRAWYRKRMAAGVDELFEPRRSTCPACGAGDLRERLRTTDLLQAKPGEFVLDECRSCRHVFQNPRLTVEGLDFYYGDFYDGAGEEDMERIFGAAREQDEARAAFVGAHTEPGRWLDVGGGHGHFTLTARHRWPEARFEIVDLSESAEEAERRGWADAAHRGLFPELAPALAGAYDVVSMHHYLEHTREPAAELDAAAAALRPGGFLSVEMPDPSSSLAPVLGRWWLPHFQPQHLNMVTRDNLERMLAARGFTVVDRHGAEAHQPVDFTFAGFLVANRLGPPVDVPWRPPPTREARLRRSVGFGLGVPLVVAGAVADNVLRPFVGRLGAANTYRVLARYDGRPAAERPPDRAGDRAGQAPVPTGAGSSSPASM